MLHLDDRAIGRLLDLADVRAAVAAAFAAWGTGEAATTAGVRAIAGERMASAMAAVVPRRTPHPLRCRHRCDLIQAAEEGMFDWATAIELHAVVAGTVSPPRAGDTSPTPARSPAAATALDQTEKEDHL